jgi:hypothetical protein
MVRIGLVMMAGMMVLGLIAASNMPAAGARPAVNQARTDPVCVVVPPIILVM